MKDVARRIVENVRDWDVAQHLVEKVRHFWETGNKQDDLSQSETHAVYHRENYGDVLPLSKKRDVEIGWSDHAEYRSDLRDMPHEDVNHGIAGWLRERLVEKGPDKKTVQMKLPSRGTAVVDYDLTRNPADADVITVWASGSSRTAIDFGPPTLAALVRQMEGKVRLSSEVCYDDIAGWIAADFIKHRMPMNRNLGTRVHRDVTKFHKPERQKEKQRLREYED